MQQMKKEDQVTLVMVEPLNVPTPIIAPCSGWSDEAITPTFPVDFSTTSMRNRTSL